ncbi:hypothetical protein [Polymorphospora rubra]|uniref:hypothetical protein n=1 Tax=Polymorphospora rubra TaxID=338584 RepID=UPI0031E246E1
MSSVVERIRSVRTVVTRATLPPLGVRGGILLTGIVALVLAYPAQIFLSRFAFALFVAAVLPVVAPRGRWATVFAVVTVGGWVLSTTRYGEPVALWRLLGLATFLYLHHTLCALAAVLPYDAVVAPEVFTGWSVRAGVVVLASAVLGILLLAAAQWGGDRTFLAAALAGFAVAVGVAALLARLLRR